jgi:type VI secretion system protein ImpH
MATYGWRQSRAVGDALFEEGHLFGFHQAVRLLEAMDRGRTPAAEGVDPAREAVRFRSTVRFDFPASEVEEIKRPKDGEPAEMTVNVMGLLGAQAPLPPWVTELALERRSRGDRALADFLDLFNHRLLSLLARARKKFRPALENRAPDKGRVASVVFSLLGLGTPHLRGSLGVSDRALLPFAGLMIARPRSMAALEQLVAAYFGVGAEIVPFRGRWQTFEEDDLTRIGAGGQRQLLGCGAMLGTRAWDPEASFEIRLGALTLAQFRDFLPRALGYRNAAALVRFYVGEELGFTIRLLLRAAEVPSLCIGRNHRALLGYTTWLRTRALLGSTTRLETRDVAGDDEQVALEVRA